MNPARVATRGLQVKEVCAGQLQDYKLVFNKMSRDHAGVGHANIQYSRGSKIEGVLYELSGSAEILKMDPFERAPWSYGREAVQIDHAQGMTWAWTYFANPAVLCEGLLPTAQYLQHLLAGREFLSEQYYARLHSWQRHE